MEQDEPRHIETVKAEDVQLKGRPSMVWTELRIQLATLEDNKMILVTPQDSETQRKCATRVSAILCRRYHGRYRSRQTKDGKVAVMKKVRTTDEPE